MTQPIRLPIRQGTPEWFAARRDLVTATDLPILLGLSPWRCEAELAEEKAGLAEPQPATLPMTVGKALEDVIAEAYAAEKGVRVRRVHQLWRSGTIAWAGASPDATIGRQPLELKWTGSRSRFADGLPQDVEAQARWQALVADVPTVEVATLTVGEDRIRTFTVERDAALERDLIAIAADFRERLAAGGPFAESNDHLKRRWPRDNGAVIPADAEITGWVRSLLALRAQRRDIEQSEDGLEAAIKDRMGEVAVVRGSGFSVSWRRTKDRSEIDWKALGEHLMGSLPETDRAAVVGPFVTVREGFRPFRVTADKED